MSFDSSIEIPIWPYAYGSPKSSGKIKSCPDDFIVEEVLSFQPEGEGEHVFLQIQKKAENTEYIARLLARFAGVRQRDIGYAGLKDRHGKTTQWFSVWLPGKDEPDWKQMETENINVLQSIRHARKLKRGVLASNYFQLIIRDWAGDRQQLEKQLQAIKQKGFPNYFGSQRFGYQGQNVNKALAFLQGKKTKRELRSLYLSAIRSYLFNQILAKRVEAENWNQAISGDVFVLAKSNSYFKTGQIEEEIIQRIQQGDIQPTAIMYGEGEMETSDEALAIEMEVINKNKNLADGLIKQGLSAGRRALNVIPDKLQWDVQTNSEFLLSFSLASGCYATSLLREIVEFE